MTDKKVLEYAIKGIVKEIDDLEKTINQGKQYLKQYENGEKPKTPKTPFEIEKIIQEKKEKIEELVKFKDDLKWQLATK